MGVKKEDLEDFRYDKGDLDELKGRAMAICDFLSRIPEWRRRADEIADDVASSDDEQDVSDSVRTLGRIAAGIDEDDNGAWTDLYQAVFGSSFLVLESHYIPQDDEIPDIVAMCLEEKKRIRTDIPDGAIA